MPIQLPLHAGAGRARPAMKLHRRKFLQLAAGAAAMPPVSPSAKAQTYPARPVHIIVGFAAGSAFDILAPPVNDRHRVEFFEKDSQTTRIRRRSVTTSAQPTFEINVRGAPDGCRALSVFFNKVFQFEQIEVMHSIIKNLLWVTALQKNSRWRHGIKSFKPFSVGSTNLFDCFYHLFCPALTFCNPF